MKSAQGDVVGEAGVLGPLQMRIGTADVQVAGPRHAKTLALLVLDAGRVVPVERMIEALWEDGGPATALRQVQDAISALRGRLSRLGAPAGLITTYPGGYLLRADQLRVDLLEFEYERNSAAACTEPEEAVRTLRRALALWRGPALHGLGGLVLEAEAARLEARRVSTHVECLGLEVRLGRHRAVAEEAIVLQCRHPYDEDLAHLAMLALYRSGRRGQALKMYFTVRAGLAEELGVEPGPALRELHRAILADDPSLGPPREQSPKVAALAARGTGAGDVPVATTGAGTHDAITAALLRQLPPDLPTFTGREDVVRRLLDAALGHAQASANAACVVAVEGMAGVGKTQLAVHTAHALVRAGHFTDAQLYVNLRGFDAERAPADPGEVLEGFLRALGVSPQSIPAHVDGRAAMFRDRLHGRSALLVLDNAADSDQVRDLLPAEPGCLVLVTSRRSLAGIQGALWHQLEVFSEREALALLARIAGEGRSARSLRRRVRSCERVGCCRWPCRLPRAGSGPGRPGIRRTSPSVWNARTP